MTKSKSVSGKHEVLARREQRNFPPQGAVLPARTCISRGDSLLLKKPYGWLRKNTVYLKTPDLQHSEHGRTFLKVQIRFFADNNRNVKGSPILVSYFVRTFDDLIGNNMYASVQR